MWALLLIPAAALGGYLYSQRHPSATASKDAAPPAPGTGTVDGHGTGVLTGPVAGVPVPPGGTAVPGLGTVDGHGTGSLDGDSIAAAAAAALAAQNLASQKAAADAAARIAQQQNPGAAGAAAGAAAEAVRIQLITALNTPETDRTPEQLALLDSLASLPTLG